MYFILLKVNKEVYMNKEKAVILNSDEIEKFNDYCCVSGILI